MTVDDNAKWPDEWGQRERLIRDILAIHEEWLSNMSDDELNEQWWLRVDAQNDEIDEDEDDE